MAELPHDFFWNQARVVPPSDPTNGDTRPGKCQPPAANLGTVEIRQPISVTVAIEFEYNVLLKFGTPAEDVLLTEVVDSEWTCRSSILKPAKPPIDSPHRLLCLFGDCGAGRSTSSTLNSSPPSLARRTGVLLLAGAGCAGRHDAGLQLFQPPGAKSGTPGPRRYR